MPLPFAPPPKESSLYQQLESTTLSTLTSEQLDTIRAKTFSQGTEGNEDEYRRLLLLGLAANQLSLSGPIRGTQKIVQVESTGGAATLFRPEAGTVWELVGVSQIRTGGSGSTTTALRIADGSDTVLIEEFADNSGEASLATSESHPIRITYDNYLTIGYSPGANATKITGYASVIQVR
jgi:hypothetical protein